jgi:hypothetical protein
MDPTVDKLGNRLKTLMGDISFKGYDNALNSPDQFMAICTYNSREYRRFEAMDEERQERIWNLFSHMLAVALQEKAIEKHGNTDEESIRKILNEQYIVSDSQEYWNRIMRLTKEYFLGIGLTEKQIHPIMEYLDTLPMAMIETLMDLTEPWRFFPATNAQSIALSLTDLMKEVGV